GAGGSLDVIDGRLGNEVRGSFGGRRRGPQRRPQPAESIPSTAIGHSRSATSRGPQRCRQFGGPPRWVRRSRQSRTAASRLRERRRQGPRTLRASRQLAPKAYLDQAKIGIVPTPIEAEDALVPLGNDCEAPILFRPDRPLELFGAPRLDDESARG